MGALTGVLYAALMIYLGGWYMGHWSGQLNVVMVLLTGVSLLYWLAERFYFAPARRAQAKALLEQHQARQAALAGQGLQPSGSGDEAAAALQAQALAQPWWLDWTAGLFPVLIVVLVLRSFLFEPFKIPSGSMTPTLWVGDFILVNKFHYGLRLPVLNTKIVSNHSPARGDVMVFRYPPNPQLDYIKRVVGLPGDVVRFQDQQLFINDKLVPSRKLPEAFFDESRTDFFDEEVEQLGELEHRILLNRAQGTRVEPRVAFPFQSACRYEIGGVTCTVPPGHYFLMGDNRDNSEDSRFWGFVPEENIVGRAFFVWMNFSKPSRIGAFH